MKHREFDKTDKIILAELQMNAQRPITDLAAKAGLSSSSCHRRVKLLEAAVVITSYTANLDRAALGLANEFFVEVSLVAQTGEAFEKFEKAVQRVPEILECHLMSGQFDYLLRVAATDAADDARHQARDETACCRRTRGWPHQDRPPDGRELSCRNPG